MSATSEELMAHLNAESSGYEATASDDGYEYEYDGDDSSLWITTSSSSSIGDILETYTIQELSEEDFQVIPEVNGESRLIRIISWVAVGYRTRAFDFEDGLPSDVNARPGQNDFGEPGRAKLEYWLKVIEDAKRMRERQLEKELRREARLKSKSKTRKMIKKWINRCVNEPMTPPLSPTEGQREIRRSCVSEETKIKKGNGFFRARRRCANVFRKVERPVESKIAAERFVIE